MNEKIQKRIEQLTKDRDAFLAQANQQIAAFNGAIGELTALLAPEAEQAEEVDMETQASAAAGG